MRYAASGKGLARRTLAGKGRDIGGLGHGSLGGDFILRRRALAWRGGMMTCGRGFLQSSGV
jgi:hypothetical protein